MKDEDRTHERSGRFPVALVAPQARAVDTRRRTRPHRKRRQSAEGSPTPRNCRRLTRPRFCAGAERKSRPSISRTCRRSNRSRPEPTFAISCRPGVPMSLTRAALRRAWIGRSRDPRLYRASGEPVGLHQPIPSPASARLIRPRFRACSPRSSARPKTPLPQCLSGQPEVRSRRRRTMQSQKVKSASADDRKNVSTDPGKRIDVRKRSNNPPPTTLRSAMLRIATKKMTRRKTRALTAN